MRRFPSVWSSLLTVKTAALGTFVSLVIAILGGEYEHGRPLLSMRLWGAGLALEGDVQSHAGAACFSTL